MAETPDSPASSLPPAPPAAPTPPADPARSDTAPGSPTPRRRVDRRILAALAAVIVIAALLALALPQFFSSTPSKTIWQEITAGITDGTVPKQTALEAFAYVFRTDIPGVSVPKGQDAGDVPTSSSGVMRWVKANWDSLTPAQQAVIDRYTAPQPGPHFTPGETLANPANGIQLAAYRPPATEPTQPDRLSFPIDTTVAPDAPGDLALAMAFDVEADIAHIGPKLGMPVLSNGGPLAPNITLTLSDLDGGNGVFLTQAIEDGFGDYMPCHITAWKNLWSTQQAQGDSVSPVLHDLLTHEVVHCYQNVVWASVATALAMPPWITEGTAIYLSADDTQVAEPMMQSMWQKGYYVPETPLTNRSYDAYGYYSLLAHEGRDMWSLMLPAWQAAAAGAQRSDAYIAVLKGDDPDIRNNWAESYVDNSTWGDPWQLYGLFAPHPANVFQHPVSALLNDGTDGSLESRSNTLLNVNTAYGEVVVVSTDGLASAIDDGTNTKLDFTHGTFCVSDKGCVCPDGTELAGQDMAPDPMSIPFTLAMNAPEGGSHYNIASYKLDDLCHKKETPRPSYQPQPQPQNPCGTSCSNSNGDPHMLTINSYRYDFQAAGEFTLLRSPDGSVDIQARQEPYTGSQVVSINTAVATKVGDHRVGVYFNGSGLEAHVDGTVADFSSGPIDLGNGGSISAIAKGYEVDFPDGTKLWALSVGHWGINAEIKPSAAIATTAQGLLGEVAPGGLGVPNLPDGTRLPAATSKADRFQTLYGQFADAWRITDATSLFDYDQGKNTESYTIKPFPTDSSLQSTADLTADQRAAGESACGSITDQGLLDDCIYDVAVTGQAGFADSYTAVQDFYDNGIQPAETATPQASLPAVTPAPGNVSAGWKVPGATNVANFAWGDNDTLYASVQTGDQSYALMHLDPVNQQVLAQVAVPAPTEVHYAAGSVWLPGLKTDASGNSCSVTRFDGQTLAEQATIAVPCGYFGKPEMASDGTNIWFVDVSKFDLTTQKGAVMTMLDPTSDAPSSTSVALPFINGYRIDSQGAFFYYDTDPKNGYYRLTAGSDAFESLGGLNSPAHPAGSGLWVQSRDGQTAQYVTSAGSPQATVQIGGSLLTGDASGVYAEVLGNGPSGATEEQLWRYPSDGSTPSEVATAPLLDGQFLSYFGDPLPIDDGNGILTFWNIGNNLGGPFLLIQWVPVK